MYLCYYTDYITTNGDYSSFFNVFVVRHSPPGPTTVTTKSNPPSFLLRFSLDSINITLKFRLSITPKRYFKKAK